MKAARDLIGIVVKLAAGMKHGKHYFKCRNLALRVLVDRNASAIVHYRHRVIRVYCYQNLGTKAGQRLVYRVVDHLIDQVMQTRGTGRANIHAWALAHCLQAFEDLDLRPIILMLFGHRAPFAFSNKSNLPILMVVAAICH